MCHTHTRFSVKLHERPLDGQNFCLLASCKIFAIDLWTPVAGLLAARLVSDMARNSGNKAGRGGRAPRANVRCTGAPLARFPLFLLPSLLHCSYDCVRLCRHRCRVAFLSCRPSRARSHRHRHRYGISLSIPPLRFSRLFLPLVPCAALARWCCSVQPPSVRPESLFFPSR